MTCDRHPGDSTAFLLRKNTVLNSSQVTFSIDFNKRGTDLHGGSLSHLVHNCAGIAREDHTLPLPPNHQRVYSRVTGALPEDLGPLLGLQQQVVCACAK